MDKEAKEQRFRDYLSKGASLDMDSFESDVRKDAALRRSLKELEVLCDHVPVPNRDRMWHVVHSVVRKRRIWFVMRCCAMVATVLLSVGMILFYEVWNYWEGRGRECAEVRTGESKKVQLFMAEGQVMELTGIGIDTLLQRDGVDIRVTRGKGLTYSGGEKAGVVPVYDVLRVPRGNEFYIKLSDGSEVWLNSDSELRFPVKFVGNERKLYLKGEAYFKVTKDLLRPFRVMVEEMLVEVLGTSFNVNGYRDERALVTTLVEGSVKVKDTVSGFECRLCPGQQVELSDGRGVVREVLMDGVIAWKEGRFLFREMPLEEIAKQLERWFDVEFVFQDKVLREHRFTGVVKRYNGVEEICALIGETTKMEFEIHGNKVVVSSKR